MISRRAFVRAGGLTMLSLGFAPGFLARAAASTAARRRLLIAIFQRGAVDGLNMVVPYGEAEYYRLRPTIAIPRPGTAGTPALDLDGFFALHPRLQTLRPLWDEGTLAVVHACGSHDPTRSHFDAQDYMETATPGVKSTRDGWLNRYLQASESTSPLRGVAIARQMPRTLQGRAPAIATPSLQTFTLRGGMAAEKEFASAFGTPDGRFAPAARDALDAMRALRAATLASAPSPESRGYPRTAFGQALGEIAQLAKADVGLEVAFAESGGWDHHVNQGGTEGQFAARVDDLGSGIAALVRDLGSRMADTVVLTMSEFGRAAAENGNRGTDHGHGNVMLLIGGPVKGRRVYGRWPGLAPEARFEGRDLAITTDFRDLFAEIAIRHLGLTVEAVARVFPGFTPGAPLGVIQAG